MMTPQFALMTLLVLPLAACPVIYLVGRIALRAGNPPTLARWLAILSAVLLWLPLATLAQAVTQSGAVEVTLGSIGLRMDGIGLLLAVTVALMGLLVLIFSVPYMKGEVGEEKYYALLPAMMATMMGLGCANDLFNLWVWFEAMTVSSYLLVAFYRDEPGSLESGVKYLVQSATGSALVLLAIALTFAEAKTLDLTAIPQTEFSLVTLAAGALFLIGFGVKTALVPMHTWLPDAHSQAPSGISAMLSGVVIEAGLVALLRSVGSLPIHLDGFSAWSTLLLGFGALNILVGNLMALRQTQLKRMLAYSSLAHMGYMLLGFGVAAGFHNADAAAGGFFHLFNHALMKGLAFLAAGTLLYALHIGKGDHSPLILDDLNGAARRYPLTVFGLSIAVLALGGLPPLAGFMSKWQIFAAGAATQNVAVIALMLFAGINSVLSLGYYAPLVNRMYRREPSAVVTAGLPAARLMQLPVILMTLAVVVIGFMPSLLNSLTSPAAQSMMRLFGGQ